MLPQEILEKNNEIKQYLKLIGVNTLNIKDENLMLEVFVHKSYACDYIEQFSHNERLEFLGDSVLGAFISKFLFKDFPEKEESILTLYRIALVRMETLAECAFEINLNEFIFLGKGEEKTGGRTKSVILGDALEALIGFIYLDLGEIEVEKFIKKYIYIKLDKIKEFNIRSYKSLLQELIQKTYKFLPIYKDYEFEKDVKGNVIVYKSEVYILNNKVGEGLGQNKKKSQEEAAKVAYQLLYNEV